jgi:hypothetical protein
MPHLSPSGGPVFGGTYPAMIFQQYMAAALAGQPVLDFPPPPHHRPSEPKQKGDKGKGVPNVRGRQFGQAAAILARAGFGARAQVVPSNAPAGRVVGQSPAAGTDAPRGTVVTLQVSLGRGGGGGGGAGSAGGGAFGIFIIGTAPVVTNNTIVRGTGGGGGAGGGGVYGAAGGQGGAGGLPKVFCTEAGGRGGDGGTGGAGSGGGGGSGGGSFGIYTSGAGTPSYCTSDNNTISGGAGGSGGQGGASPANPGGSGVAGTLAACSFH